MRRIPFPPLVCGLLLSLSALAQDGPVTIRAEVTYQAEARRFIVNGETDFPDHVILGLVMSFGGEAITGAIARAEVKGGQFSFTVGPVDRHVLAGTYDIDLRYSRFDQVAALKARLADAVEQKIERVACYVGTREQEEQENKQYKSTLQEGLTETRRLYGDVRTKAKEYLEQGKKFNEAEFSTWMKNWRSELATLQALTDRIGGASVFAPKYPESVRDLSVIANFLDLLFLHYFREICQKNGLDPSSAEALDPRPVFSLMVDEYIREIERRTAEVEAREDTKKEPTSFDLYRDLLDYQGLFSSLLEAYDRARREGDPEAAWKKRDPPWVAAVDGFTGRTARYKGSAIEKAHPEVEGGLSAALDALAKGLMDLDAGFAKAVKDAPPNGALPPAMKEPVDGIRARFKKLYDIVLKERYRIIGEVEGKLGGLVDLSQELEVTRPKAESGEMKKDAWASFLSGWRDRLSKQRDAIAKWAKESQATFHLPESPRRLAVLGQCLDLLAGCYDDCLNGNKAATTDERLRYNRDTRQKLIKEIRLEVEEVRKDRR